MARVFGTDCYTDALQAVRTECRNLDHEGKTRLALAFANCHLYKLGKRTYTCSAGMPLKACVNHKDPEFYFAHMQFFSEIDRCRCLSACVASAMGPPQQSCCPRRCPCPQTVQHCDWAAPCATIACISAKIDVVCCHCAACACSSRTRTGSGTPSLC